MLLYAWPFLEARVTGDRGTHHLLDRPSVRPVRTALGALVLTFYGILFFAGSNDVIALWLHVGVNDVTTVLRVLLLALPPLVGLLTHRLCKQRAIVKEERWRELEAEHPDLPSAGPPELELGGPRPVAVSEEGRGD